MLFFSHACEKVRKWESKHRKMFETFLHEALSKRHTPEKEET